MALQVLNGLGDPNEWDCLPLARDIAMLDPDTSQFTTMLHRLSGNQGKNRKLAFDPKLNAGDLLFRRNGECVGRVTRVTTNLNPDDWFSVATEWVVWYEEPWNVSTLTTNYGDVKVEWLEDQLFPRTARIIDFGSWPGARNGDIVIVGPSA